MILFGGVLILLLLAVTAACGGEATPTALQDVVGDQPNPTSVPVPTPTREATPAALQNVVRGVRIRAERNLLFLTAKAIQQDVVQRIAPLDGVSRVDLYLEVDAEPNSIVGVSPGSPLRFRGELMSLTSGEDFSPDEELAAIPGTRVNANRYGFGMAGSLMAHRFQVGQTFELQGQRLRVTDLYQAERDELEDSIMLPLSTAQRLYDMEGVVTTVVVSIDPPRKLEQVQRAIQRLLGGDQ